MARHKWLVGGVVSHVNAATDALAGVDDGRSSFDIESIFCAQYDRIARVISRVVHDPARAEDLAVEVFLRLWRNPKAHSENTDGWLYRTALRMALDELRRRARRAKYELLLGWMGRPRKPDEIHHENEQQARVRVVLSQIAPRHAELLLLRGDGLSYSEVASALHLNPASIGTLLSRAQGAFRREYIKRYGQEH